MNEIRIHYTTNEAVSTLRNLGATVEERRVTKFSGEESWNAWEWQIQTASGKWIDAEAVYRQLVETGFWRSIGSNLNRLDLLGLIK